MATTTQPLKYLWTAEFEDDHIIVQPKDDQYSKHDDTAEWNPSAFRDILDYEETCKLSLFWLVDSDDGILVWGVDLTDGYFWNGKEYEFTIEETPLTDRKLIYFREMRVDWHDGVQQEAYVNRYAIGYEGKDKDGKVHKKVIYINA